MARLAADVSSALPLSPFELGGTDVPLVSDPEFMFVDGADSRKCTLHI